MENTVVQSPSAQSLSASPAEGLYLQIVLNSDGQNTLSKNALPALLPAPQLVEILTVPIGQVVPIFHVPPWVMGVYNWRGEVLWIVDFNHLLGLSPWYEQENYGSKHTVVVLQEISDAKEKAIVGLAVSRVEEMIQCTADQLHFLSRSAEARSLFEALSEVLPTDSHRFVSGYWQGDNAPLCWLLNGAAILQSLSELPA